MHREVKIWISMFNSWQLFNWNYFHVQFLLYFSNNGHFKGFPLFNFTSREFELLRNIFQFIQTSLNTKNFSFILNYRCNYVYFFHWSEDKY